MIGSCFCFDERQSYRARTCTICFGFCPSLRSPEHQTSIIIGAGADGALTAAFSPAFFLTVGSGQFALIKTFAASQIVGSIRAQGLPGTMIHTVMAAAVGIIEAAFFIQSGSGRQFCRSQYRTQSAGAALVRNQHPVQPHGADTGNYRAAAVRPACHQPHRIVAVIG